MHVFPHLRKLEQKYMNELVVIGVHSAKFTSEKDTENLRKAVLRYELEHPVINDGQFNVWQQYACRAWPTLIFIDPQGKIIGKHEGEITFEDFDPLFGQMVQQVFGCGEAGLEDGDSRTARFDHPQGIALEGDALYVADTESHAIRRLDLGVGTVKTIGGTGRQARGFGGGGDALDTDLSSPWDLVVHGNTIYIAMAGSHQLWALDLERQLTRPYAGNGQESPIDGPLLSASLDQPTGITTDGRKLYFADSEASAIRSADLDSDGRVSTIVGFSTCSSSVTWMVRVLRCASSTLRAYASMTACSTSRTLTTTRSSECFPKPRA